MSSQLVTAQEMQYLYFYRILARAVRVTLIENIFDWAADKDVLVPADNTSKMIVVQVVKKYQQLGFSCSDDDTNIIIHGKKSVTDLKSDVEHPLDDNVVISANELNEKFEQWMAAKDIAVSKVNAQLRQNIDAWYTGSNIVVQWSVEPELADVLLAMYKKNGFRVWATTHELILARNTK